MLLSTETQTQGTRTSVSALPTVGPSCRPQSLGFLTCKVEVRIFPGKRCDSQRGQCGSRSP